MSEKFVFCLLALVGAHIAVVPAQAGRNDFNFKLGAFSDNPAIAQSAFSAEASDLKRDKQKREEDARQAENDNEFFGRTAEAGVVSIITQRIQSETTGSAQSGNEIIQWTTEGGIRTVRFVDALTGQVRRTITFSVI